MRRNRLVFERRIGGFTAAIVVCSLALAAPRSSLAQECQPTELSFSFSADPAQPRVGDFIALTIRIHRTNTAGLPVVALSGTVPLLGGDLVPDPPVSPSGPVPASVTYHLQAVQAGEATLTFRIIFEGVTACSPEVGPVFGNLGAVSQPFQLVIGPPGEGTVGPPTFTPTPTPTATIPSPTPPTPTTTLSGSPTSTPTPATSTATPTASVTPTSPPAVALDGGCSVHEGGGALPWLLLLPAVIAALRRRQC